MPRHAHAAFPPCALLLILAACTTGGADRDRRPDFLRDGAIPDGGPPDAGTGSDAASPDPCTPERLGSTLGDACASVVDCDDRCFCNGVERCEEGVCVAGADPCADDVDCTADDCLEETDQCLHEPEHGVCQDEDACNGYEVCDVRLGCRAASPLYCNDENACTIDSCDTEMGCVHDVRDLDGDGYRDGRCGGMDCDDDPRGGGDIHPGADEVCDNGRDDDCDGLRDFADSECIATNDDCASARMLPGPGTYSASTSALDADYTLSCREEGQDAVFRFELEEPQDVRVTLSGGGPGGAVALRPWDRCDTGPDERCSARRPPSVLHRSLPAGAYAILVQTSSGTPFDLQLRFDPPTPVPPVDVCNGETEDISEGGTFTGFFEEVQDDYALTCHERDGFRDVAYRLVLDETRDVQITGSTSGASFGTTTFVSLVRDCEDERTAVQCRSGSSASVSARSLEAGTYFVLLESSSGDATTWTLEAEITDPVPRPEGDACSTALDITEGPMSATLDTAELDAGASCGSSSSIARDLVFFFDLPETRDVTLTTTGAGIHQVGLQTECGVVGSELRCRHGGEPLEQTFRSLAEGRYFVVVQTTLSSGTVTAEIETGPPTPVPPNDRCDGAIDISGGYSGRDTLEGFEDDVSGCIAASAPDAFYELTLTERKRVLVFAERATEATDQVYLTLRNACGASTNLACDDGTGGAALSETLDPGTYFVIVEMPSGTEEEFLFDVIVRDP